jgi:hypothetical protein
MDLTRADLHLHVEEIVLHGVDPADRHAIGDAVRAELARLLAERGISGALAGLGGAARLDGGALHLPAGASAHEVGAGIAARVAGAAFGPAGGGAR